ncbi:MAG: S41 family peptidase [Candidatus Muirbacterium halophilum]|nr:S41 family peptidase [Candidatus Muirbacterium halophilum]
MHYLVIQSKENNFRIIVEYLKKCLKNSGKDVSEKQIENLKFLDNNTYIFILFNSEYLYLKSLNLFEEQELFFSFLEQGISVGNIKLTLKDSILFLNFNLKTNIKVKIILVPDYKKIIYFESFLLYEDTFFSDVPAVIFYNYKSYYYGIVNDNKVQMKNLINKMTKKFIDYKRLIFEDEAKELIIESMSIKKKNYILKEINNNQAIEDIDDLVYIMTKLYAGYYFHLKKGVDLLQNLELLRNLVSDKNIIKTMDFENSIIKAIGKLYDSHVSLKGFKKTTFLESTRLYVSDVKVEKTNNKYHVTQSKKGKLKIGTIYTGSEDFLFRTFSENSNKKFLIGVLSSKKIYDFDFEFENRKTKLLVCENDIDSFKKNKKLFDFKDSGVPLLKLSNFLPESDDERKQLEKFITFGEKLAYKNDIVIDLRNNYGGTEEYFVKFLRNFLSYESITDNSIGVSLSCFENEKLILDLEDSNDIISILKKNINEKHKIAFLKKIKYRIMWLNRSLEGRKSKKKIVFLTNKNTASSAESFIDFAKSNCNVLVIGTNTYGAENFGGCSTYILKNSKLEISIPTNILIYNNKNEDGIGILPDYWVESEEELEKVLKGVLKT